MKNLLALFFAFVVVAFFSGCDDTPAESGNIYMVTNDSISMLKERNINGDYYNLQTGDELEFLDESVYLLGEELQKFKVSKLSSRDRKEFEYRIQPRVGDEGYIYTREMEVYLKRQIRF